MDSSASPDPRLPEASWSPLPLWPSLQMALGVALLLAGMLRGDPLALFLTLFAGGVLIWTGYSHLRRSPRLEVLNGQLAIATLRGPRLIAPSEVREIRELSVSRWGMRSHLMRVEYVDSDGKERLDIFTKMDLNADPRDVVERLTQLGFPGRSDTGD